MTNRYACAVATAICRFTSSTPASATRRLSSACTRRAHCAGAKSGIDSETAALNVFCGVNVWPAMPRLSSSVVFVPVDLDTGQDDRARLLQQALGAQDIGRRDHHARVPIERTPHRIVECHALWRHDRRWTGAGGHLRRAGAGV